MRLLLVVRLLGAERLPFAQSRHGRPEKVKEDRNRGRTGLASYFDTRT